MKYGVYSIYDEAANEYGPVFTAKNDAVAKRQFLQLVKSVEYPAEYGLFKVGDFDSECMEFPLVGCESKEVIDGLKLEKGEINE